MMQAPPRLSNLPFIAVALLLFGLAFYIYFPLAADHPFAYDEADYMWAGKLGVWANYTDRNALSFFEFLQKGLELARDPSKRSSFSQFIRSRGDAGLYRHYHGPMYAYWLAVMHNLGVTQEHVFRGSGLFIHLGTATLILAGLWAAFPVLPKIAGLVGCALFLFSRTALVAAMGITQHVVFTLVCVATLMAASLFFRTLDTRWFYACMSALAIGFCTVETSFLLVGALVVCVLLEHRRLRQKWPTLKSFAKLLMKGLLVFVATALVCWPKGVLQLGIAKGFMNMAYFSVYRKTFGPLGLFGLLRVRFEASPWEFSLLVLGVLGAFALWRRSPERDALLPWLAFIVMFFLVMLKVTLEYTYYYAPLVAAFAVTSAVTFGTLWQRFGTTGRLLLSLPVLLSIIGTTVQYQAVASEIRDSTPYHIAVLRWLKEHPVPQGLQLYVPFQLVPTLHYYHPELAAVGYVQGFPAPEIAKQATSSQGARAVLCEEPLCSEVKSNLPAGAELLPLDPSGPGGTPLYALTAPKPNP